MRPICKSSWSHNGPIQVALLKNALGLLHSFIAILQKQGFDDFPKEKANISIIINSGRGETDKTLNAVLLHSEKNVAGSRKVDISIFERTRSMGCKHNVLTPDGLFNREQIEQVALNNTNCLLTVR